jgi:hypothetical protein
MPVLKINSDGLFNSGNSTTFLMNAVTYTAGGGGAGGGAASGGSGVAGTSGTCSNGDINQAGGQGEAGYGFTTAFAGIDLLQYYLWHFGEIFVLLVGSGVLIGGVSSFLAVKRYLKV